MSHFFHWPLIVRKKHMEPTFTTPPYTPIALKFLS